MKFMNFTKILCLSPHPDDIEYGMMGTIIKFTDTHFDILCLSLGGDYDITSSNKRHNEINECWNLSECKNVDLHVSDCSFIKDKTHDQWINYIEKRFNINQYDAICVPSQYDSHYEHVCVSKLALPISRVTPIAVVEYKTPSSLDNWIPNVVVNVNKEITKKIECLRKFTSQQDRVYFNIDLLKMFHVNFQALKKGYNIVEQFKIVQSYIF